MNRFFKFIILTFLLAATITIDVFLFFWEGLKKHKIFPGS